MKPAFFDLAPDRLNSNSFKWDYRHVYFGDRNVIPLHIADMDFFSAPPILEALKNRLEKDVFGYSVNSPQHFHFLAQWLAKHHGWEILPQWCLHSPSAVCSIGLILNAMTLEGDGVIVQTPSYPPFLSTVLNFKRKLLINKLLEENGYYSIDFEDFEQKCQQGAKFFILCSPHNPTGRVWRREELERLIDICARYQVHIISDELHSDLVYPGFQHVPTASVCAKSRDMTLTLVSPSKTFNLAGISMSCIIIADKNLRNKIEKEFEKFHLYIPNSFGAIAFDAAYSHGEEWYCGLMSYLLENKKICENFFRQELPQFSISIPESTFLLWINFKNLSKNDKELKRLFHKELKLGLEPGLKYGENGEGWMRLNFALQRDKLTKVLFEIKNYFNSP